MFGETQISPEDFEKMLSWLSNDRDAAGSKYEEIRSSLIEIFIWRGCDEAEELADIVVNRVTQRVQEVSATYEGDPALYFYGVARNLLREHYRWQKRHTTLPEVLKAPTTDIVQIDPREMVHSCLAICIKHLKPGESELIMDYYDGEKHIKIDNRRTLASHVGVASNTLRVRVHRIRNTLERCIKKCLKTKNQ